MINAVVNATQTQPAAQFTPVKKESPQSKPKTTATDTVQISSASKAAMQEATETSAQTAQEASSGDLQAQLKLARQAAAKMPTGSSHSVKA